MRGSHCVVFQLLDLLGEKFTTADKIAVVIENLAVVSNLISCKVFSVSWIMHDVHRYIISECSASHPHRALDHRTIGELLLELKETNSCLHSTDSDTRYALCMAS